MTGEDLLFAGVLALLASALWIVRHFANPPMALHQWATAQGFMIVRARYREFTLGPFAMGGLRSQQDLYQVIIRTPDGVKRAAWVRCDYASGSARVEVIWGVVSSKPAAGMRTQSHG